MWIRKLSRKMESWLLSSRALGSRNGSEERGGNACGDQDIEQEDGVLAAAHRCLGLPQLQWGERWECICGSGVEPEGGAPRWSRKVKVSLWRSRG